MNNKPLPCFDELSFIFGVDLAIGDDAIQQGDAASILKGAAGGSDFMDMDAEVGESYNIPEDLDHTAVMQDIINQGIDLHATGSQGVEAEVTSNRVHMKSKGKEQVSSSGTKRSRQQYSDDNNARIAASMEMANDTLSKLATSYCIETELAGKRQFLYEKLAKFPELTVSQRTRAMRHLSRDDGNAHAFFQFPTAEEKLEFLWMILE
ncbi:hypothetical protein LINGRAHAP2_LOCUS32842 [Linum grandiflorum]